MRIDAHQAIEIGYSAQKTFATLVFSLLCATFAGFTVFTVLSTSQSIGTSFIPFSFLVIFTILFLVHLARFFRLNEPVIQISPSGIFDKRVQNEPVAWSEVVRLAIRRGRSRRVCCVELGVSPKQFQKFRQRRSWIDKLGSSWRRAGISIAASGLSISQDSLKEIIETYAKAHNGPAVR